MSRDQYRRLGLLVVATELAKFCLDDPTVCQKEICRSKIVLLSAEVRTGKRCLGKMTTVSII